MSLASLQEAIITALLVGAAVVDIRKREVSDALCVITALAALLCFQPGKLLGLIPAVLLFIIALTCGADTTSAHSEPKCGTDAAQPSSDGGIGGGDIKLYAALSICLGLEGSIVLLFISQASMLIFYGIYAAVQKIRGKTAEKYLPFVPFMLLGYLSTIMLI